MLAARTILSAAHNLLQESRCVPKGYSQMKRSEQVAYWLAAVEKEYAGLIANGTWESMRVVDLPTGANVVNCHLVFTIKRKSDGTIERYKARLVADGSTQRHGLDCNHIFSTGGSNPFKFEKSSISPPAAPDVFQAREGQLPEEGDEPLVFSPAAHRPGHRLRRGPRRRRRRQ